ncbi:MAG: NADPH-dependent FMN reductase [Puniceicoccaceae bacterium]
MKIAILSGSTRKGSYNFALARVVERLLLEMGQEPDLIEPEAYKYLPLYDAEIEAEGLPEDLLALARRFSEAGALIFVSPEYNASLTPLLKNTIDWLSRARNRVGAPIFEKKVAGLLSASPGGLGGMRGLNHLRDILGNLNMLIPSQQYSMRSAHEIIEGKPSPTDQVAELRSGVEPVLKAVVEIATKLG